MKNKIYFIGTFPNFMKNETIGGETIKNQELLEYLKKRNYQVKIIDILKKENKIIKYLKIMKLLLDFKTKKIVISLSDDYVYRFLKLYNFFKFLKKDIYYFVVGGEFPKLGKDKLTHKDKKYYKSLKAIYVETLIQKERLEIEGFRNVKHLYNFRRITKKDLKNKKKIEIPLNLVFMSRIIKEKGVELIFKMLKEINKNEVKIKVDFWGPIAIEYEKEFLENLNGVIGTQYKGVIRKREEIINILSRYDLFLFPTYWKGEGIPGVLIEAIEAEVPIIASDWKYNTEIVNQNIGYIFESKNSESLIKTIQEILFNPLDKIIEKKKNCSKEIKKYDIDVVLKDFIEMIRY